MKNSLLLVSLLLVLPLTELFGWGRKGHDAIAYIAECNLTPQAQETIEKYLGHSIVYDASWMDRYRKTPEYLFTDKWHMGSVDGD
ncbi:MAG: S1/P1 nuclease, partial [Bacteroidales bacterium]